MLLSYIDESGTPNKEDLEKDYTLAALTIDEEIWDDLNNRLIGLKRKYFPNKDESMVEFHAVEIFNRMGLFRSMPIGVRLDLYREIMELAADSDCIINAVIVRKDLVGPEYDVNAKATKLLFEMIEHTINEVHNNVSNETGHGLLMLDSVGPRFDNKVKNTIIALNNSASRKHGVRTIIEKPFFMDSKDTNMIQLIDCIVYCIRRKYRREKGPDNVKALFDSYYGIIECRIHGCKGGDDYGIIIVEKSNQ